MKKKISTKEYYRRNPASYAKKMRYQKKFDAQPKQIKMRTELWRIRKKLGIAGKGGKDVSHTKGGGYTLENVKTNRGRNGSNGASTKK